MLCSFAIKSALNLLPKCHYLNCWKCSLFHLMNHGTSHASCCLPVNADKFRCLAGKTLQRGISLLIWWEILFAMASLSSQPPVSLRAPSSVSRKQLWPLLHYSKYEHVFMCGAIYSPSCAWLHMSHEWNPTHRAWHHSGYFCLVTSSPVTGYRRIQTAGVAYLSLLSENGNTKHLPVGLNQKNKAHWKCCIQVIRDDLEVFTHLYTEDAALPVGLCSPDWHGDLRVKIEPLTFTRAARPDPQPLE